MHESQVAYLKLQAHTASLQSLKECYCRYAHMLDGARTMFNAYQQTTTKRDSIDQVKLGLKECTQVSFCLDTSEKECGLISSTMLYKNIASANVLRFPRKYVQLVVIRALQSTLHN